MGYISVVAILLPQIQSSPTAYSISPVLVTHVRKSKAHIQALPVRGLDVSWCFVQVNINFALKVLCSRFPSFTSFMSVSLSHSNHGLTL